MASKNKSSLWIAMNLLILSASLSCNNVNFSSRVEKEDRPTPLGVITCDLYLNDTLKSVTINLPGGQNPKVSAVCNPQDVTHVWTVTKGNSPVSVVGLDGANSIPNFVALGAGTYKIWTRASRTGFTDYKNEDSPLTVTINGSTGTPAVQCDPKINGNLTTFTMTNGGANPQIAANCQPTTASCVWSVNRQGQTSPVVIPGFTGCTATPNFASANPGTYQIYLTATQNNYTTYVSAQPLTVIVPERPLRAVTTTKPVTLEDNQLDVLLIVDDSNSMAADNQKLANRLQGFVADLTTAGFDWQMCVTVTRAQQLTASNPTLYWGASRLWSGLPASEPIPYILKPSAGSNIQTIFQNTIQAIGAGWAGTDDERAIKAAWWHLWNGDIRYPTEASGCYRAGAGLAVIIISDEDERSVGGDMTQQYYAGEYKPLESDDLPQTYVNFVKEVFGNSKRFTVNSIIVRPGDTACMTQQDAEGSKSHYGYKYDELVALTGGKVGSICENDYSNNLRYFKENIIRDMASLPLECAPVGTPQVSISPNFVTTTRVEGSTIYFDPRVPAGRTITVQYNCAQ